MSTDIVTDKSGDRYQGYVEKGHDGYYYGWIVNLDSDRQYESTCIFSNQNEAWNWVNKQLKRIK